MKSNWKLGPKKWHATQCEWTSTDQIKSVFGFTSAHIYQVDYSMEVEMHI